MEAKLATGLFHYLGKVPEQTLAYSCYNIAGQRNVINATFRGQDLLCVGVSAIPTAPEIIYNRKTDFGDLTSRDNIFQKEEKKMNRGYQTLVILFIYILT